MSLFDPDAACATPALAELLDAYRPPDPAQVALCREFRSFLTLAPQVFRREHAVGHFTGSAWLVSNDGRLALLMHHRKLDRWLQPGGHADGDADLAAVALREAGEETGLTGLRAEPAIFDLDRHLIPARAGEAEHWHYDVRFVVRATADENFTVNDESHALAWRDITAIAADASLDESLRRMAGRWLERGYGK